VAGAKLTTTVNRSSNASPDAPKWSEEDSNEATAGNVKSIWPHRARHILKWTPDLGQHLKM